MFSISLLLSGDFAAVIVVASDMLAQLAEPFLNRIFINSSFG